MKFQTSKELFFLQEGGLPISESRVGLHWSSSEKNTSVEKFELCWAWFGLTLPRGIAFLLISPHISKLTACQRRGNPRGNARFQLALFTRGNGESAT